MLPLFLDFVGNKLISEIKQDDINKFLAFVQKLPPRWRDIVKKTGQTARQIAAERHEITLSPKTFEDTYKACVNAFLNASVRDWQDQGFPTTLVCSSEYLGARKDGEQKQRPFAPHELKRLFEGPEMRAFGADKAKHDMYWLPHLALFTGARVNELCQLNPMIDIAEEVGFWHFKFSEAGESAAGVKKSIKNKSSVRQVPVHSKLIELGFIGHVNKLKSAKAKQLFLTWPPKGGKASPNAERWFNRHLKKLNLRDEAAGNRLVGMHAFRHTFLSRANELGVQQAGEITGHESDDSSVMRGYQADLPLSAKRDILEKITFDVEFEKPNA